MFYNEQIFKRCFTYKGKQWYRNIKKIPLYFKLMHHLIKYGYDEYANWETFNWFINIMKPILIKYRSHLGYPIISWDDQKEQKESENNFDNAIDRMITLLDDMDECNSKYKNMDYDVKYEEMYKAKDEFFKLFSEYFYYLWD